MKKPLLVLLFLLLLPKTKAQVVFCPPGAEWHYSYMLYPFGSTVNYVNETILYARDSILSLDTVKILTHSRFYLSCNEFVSVPNLTLIRQKGDTVFFRNSRTQHSWQILYNFNAPVGQGWQTTILNPYSTSLTITYGFTVDSVKYISINNFNLKRLYTGGIYFTERFGWMDFLFRFYNNDGACHGDWFSESLCYQDDSFGLNQFSGRPCTFQGSEGLGIKEIYSEEKIRLFPNPGSDILNITYNKGSHSEQAKVEIIDVLGNIVLTSTKNLGDFQIDISTLNNGIYFVNITINNRLTSQKLIKK